jgi:hypothetical protein
MAVPLICYYKGNRQEAVPQLYYDKGNKPEPVPKLCYDKGWQKAFLSQKWHRLFIKAFSVEIKVGFMVCFFHQF